MNRIAALFLLAVTASCSATINDPLRFMPEQEIPAGELQLTVQKYLDDYTATMEKLSYASSEAEWASNTRIMEGDTTNADRTKAANEALAKFTGSVENIETARKFLARREELTKLQAKQLDAILYNAAYSPQTIPEVVKEKIAAETEQVEKLYGFSFKIDGEEVTTNEIDRRLREETDLGSRLKAWKASKEVGPGLRPGLKQLQRLRNQTVRALGYDDYFTFQVSDYGMTRQEMMDLMERLNIELRPLYREIHTWARYTLAEKYGQPVPEQLPAHWLPNRWGQDWSDLVEVEGLDLEGALAEKSPEWLVQQAERFYVSLGFEPLPPVFYEKSSLYPLPEDATYKKNNHASAWHMDLRQDVRSLMSVEPNPKWYETTHHELGHIYYYLCYANPQVPLLLRGGADRAYHEGVGSLMGLAAMQKPFIEYIGLDVGDKEPDPVQTMLKEALNFVVFIPWSAGVMSNFEHDLYSKELRDDQWNKRWWELKKRYQGIVPPEPRGDENCDPPTKTHINNDAAQYYDYALSFVLLFQLHDHIASKILDQDPHATNYYGEKRVGNFLRSLLTPGATVDSQELLKEATGSTLSARAMLNYFEPLMKWLQKENRGRKHTLPQISTRIIKSSMLKEKPVRILENTTPLATLQDGKRKRNIAAITITDAEGKKRTLDSFQGKRLVVFNWASW